MLNILVIMILVSFGVNSYIILDGMKIQNNPLHGTSKSNTPILTFSSPTTLNQNRKSIKGAFILY